ncbi:MAG: GNAT family protein [Cyanobacteria bacterium P01_F01_bin.150]
MQHTVLSDQKQRELDAKIFLKTMEDNHVSHLIKLANNPSLVNLLGWTPFFESHETGKFIQAISLFAFPYSIKSPPLAFGVYRKSQALPIGYAVLKGINRRARTAEIGIAILDGTHRRRGYGFLATQYMLQHAFLKLNCQLIGAAILCSNIGSINMFKKLGFVEQQVMYRSWEMPDGTIEDMLRMELTRQRWEKLNP